MLRTRLTEEYGLEHPFISAGMGFLALPELTAAVCNAGGLGILGASPGPPEYAAALIRQTRTLTQRLFAVDFVVDSSPALGEFTTEAHMDVCIAERVRVAVFHWHLPPRAWSERLRGAGAKVWMQVGSVAAAREAVAAGADAIIAQGSEAGGHSRANTGLISLLPAVVDAIAPVPVIAAGGIADGRGVAAALALGAQAVCVGTRLIASREAYAHAEYKRRVVAASVDDITRTHIFGVEWPDQPMKVIANRVVREWAGRTERTPPSPQPPQFIGRTKMGGQDYPMPKYSSFLPTPDTEGDFEEMCLAAGESAGLVREIKPAADIIREMMASAEHLLRQRLPAMVV
ncbi:MAG TPA: nitronate monooxygenase [Candidatus Xenobia bacterium]|nr:nitronate monooxygenase [Candidatus Xenobia bacterium]